MVQGEEIDHNFAALHEYVSKGDGHPKKRLLFIIDLSSSVFDEDLILDFIYRSEEMGRLDHNVTILCVYTKEKEKSRLNSFLGNKNPEQFAISYISTSCAHLAPGLMSSACLIPYIVYEWLKHNEKNYDVVHAIDSGAILYYCTLAKKLDLFFSRLIFVVIPLRPTLWDKDRFQNPITSFVDLPVVFMERKITEWVDFVISRSMYMLKWMELNGNQLDGDRCFVQPSIMPDSLSNERSNSAVCRISKIIFLGDLTFNCGFHIVIDTIKRVLVSDDAGDLDLSSSSFLFVCQKKPERKEIKTLETVFRNTGIPWAVIISRWDDYIKNGMGEQNDSVVILPPVKDNQPLVASKLILSGIPFIGYKNCGLEDILSNDLYRILVDIHPFSIAEKIISIFKDGSLKPEAEFINAENTRVYDQWYRSLSLASSDKYIEASESPLVSVCIAHYNRHNELSAALNSVINQHYRNIEVIIVDDGSTNQGSIDYLNNLPSQISSIPVRVYRQPNLYLGASRNLAAKHANGKYVLFMDDDNLAKTNEVETFVKVAESTNADILTCFADVFMDESETDQNSGQNNRIVFPGPDLSSGLFRNPYGDSNCLVRMSAFKEIGGFTEDYKIGRDDQEFFTRSLLKGKILHVVPEALYWYRINKSRMRQGQYSEYAGLERVLRTYRAYAGLPPEWQVIFRYAQGMAAEKYGITGGGLASLTRNSALRRFAYAFPLIYKFVRPYVRKIIG